MEPGSVFRARYRNGGARRELVANAGKLGRYFGKFPHIRAVFIGRGEKRAHSAAVRERYFRTMTLANRLGGRAVN